MANRGLVIAGVGVVALGIVGLSSVFVVDEREQAIVLQLSRFVRLESRPGLHTKIPFVQSVRYFDKRVLDFDADVGEIPTKDQKQTLVDTYTRYRIKDALRFYQTARSVEIFEANREDALLNSIVKSSVRQVFAKVDLAVLLTARRAQVMRDITQLVRDETAQFGVEILDVRIKRIDLPTQNSDAVQRRMEAQRRQEATLIRAEGAREAQSIRAEADKRVRVIKAEAEQKSQILQGEGEGIAQETYNKAFGQDAEFFEFWLCMRTVREGLGGTTRFVGVPSSEFLFSLCKYTKAGAPRAPGTPAKPGERRAETGR